MVEGSEPNRDTTQDALLQLFERTDALMADLGQTDWSVQSLCPDWDVRGCLTHMAGVEAALVGWRPQAADEPPPFERFLEFEATTASMSNSEFTDEVGRIHRSRRQELSEFTDAQWTQPCVGPTGATTYGGFMDIRVFDYWVHLRDMTIPLGRTTDDSGAAAEISLDQVHQAMGYIVGKRIGLPDGMSITFDLSGGVERKIHVVVDGRAALVDAIEDADVVVSADSTAFIMLACGRIDPQQEIDRGNIAWTGADEWGDKAARSLRFTM